MMSSPQSPVACASPQADSLVQLSGNDSLEDQRLDAMLSRYAVLPSEAIFDDSARSVEVTRPLRTDDGFEKDPLTSFLLNAPDGVNLLPPTTKYPVLWASATPVAGEEDEEEDIPYVARSRCSTCGYRRGEQELEEVEDVEMEDLGEKQVLVESFHESGPHLQGGDYGMGSVIEPSAPPPEEAPIAAIADCQCSAYAKRYKMECSECPKFSLEGKWKEVSSHVGEELSTFVPRSELVFYRAEQFQQTGVSGIIAPDPSLFDLPDRWDSRYDENSFLPLVTENRFAPLLHHVDCGFDGQTVNNVMQKSLRMLKKLNARPSRFGVEGFVVTSSRHAEPTSQPLAGSHLTLRSASMTMHKRSYVLIPLRRLMCRSGKGWLYWSLAARFYSLSEDKVAQGMIKELMEEASSYADHFDMCLALASKIPAMFNQTVQVVDGERQGAALGKAKDAVANLDFFSTALTAIREKFQDAKAICASHKHIILTTVIALVIGITALLVREHHSGAFGTFAMIISVICGVILGSTAVGAVTRLLKRLSDEKAIDAARKTVNLYRQVTRAPLFHDLDEEIGFDFQGDRRTPYLANARYSRPMQDPDSDEESITGDYQAGSKEVKYVWSCFTGFMTECFYSVPHCLKMLSLVGAAYRGWTSIREMITSILECLPAWIAHVLASIFPSYSMHLMLWGSGYGEWAVKTKALVTALQKAPHDALIKLAKEHHESGLRKLGMFGDCGFAGALKGGLAQLDGAIHNGVAKNVKKRDGKQPFLLHIVGTPGIGKSSVVTMLSRLAAIELGATPNDAAFHVQPRGSDKFFPHYTPEKTVLVYDDPFNAAMDVKQTIFSELIGLIGPNEFMPLGAALEDKHRIVDYGMVIMSDNAHDPQIDDVSVNALYRRRELVHCELTPAFLGAARQIFPNEPVERLVTKCLELPKTHDLVTTITAYRHLEFFHLASIPLDNDIESRRKEIIAQRGAGRGMFTSEFCSYLRTKLKTHIEGRKTFGANVESFLSDFYNGVSIIDPGSLPEGVHDEEEIDKIEALGTSMVPAILRGVIFSFAAIATFVGAIFVYQRHNKPANRQYSDRLRADEVKKRLQPNRFGAKSGSRQAGSLDDPVEDVRARVFRIDSSEKFVHGMMLDGQTAVLPKHFIDEVGDDEPLLLHFTPEGTEDIFERFDVTRCAHFAEDLLVYRLSRPIPGFRKFHGRFADEPLRPNSELTRVGPRFDSSGKSGGLARMRLPDGEKSEVFQQYHVSNGRGDCGMPILDRRTNKIVGFHSGGDVATNTGFFSVVGKEHVSRVLAADWDVVEPETFYDGEFTRQMSTHVPDGNRRPAYMVSNKVSANCKREFRKTPMWTDDCGVAPAELRASKVIPMESRFCITTATPPKEHLDFAEACATRAFGEADFGTPRRLMTDAEVIAGLDVKKSVGWPHTVHHLKRTDFIDFEQEALTPLGLESVGKVWKMLLSEVLPPLVVQPDLKSELLPLEKIAAGKTRTFEKLPLEWLIVGRRLFGHWHDEMTAGCNRLPTAIGMDVNSLDWDKLYRALKKFDLFFDLDYKAFEATVTYIVLERAIRVVNHWYGDANDSPIGQARFKFAWSMTHAWRVADVMCWLGFQSMPSGSPLTAPENSICNFLLMACAFKSIYPKASPSDFLSCVMLKIYGDDVICGVKEIAHEFNFVNVKAYLTKLGFTITPGNKSADEQPFVPFDTLTFLKKSFRAVPGLPIYGAYVTTRKMLDQLSWCRDTTPEGLLQLAQSVLSSAFFHGRSEYNNFRRSVAAQFDLECVDLPTWQEMYYRYFGQLPTGVTRLPTFVMPEIPADRQAGLLAAIPSLINASKTFFSGASAAVGAARDTGSAMKSMAAGKFNDPGSMRSGEHCDNDVITVSMMPQPVADGVGTVRNTFDGTDIAITMDDYHQLVGAEPATFQTTEDEMTVDKIKRTWALISSFTINDSYGTGQLLFTLNMTPFQLLGPSCVYGSLVELSPLEWLASMHRYWRGSIELRLQVVAPRDATGTIFIVFAYGIYDSSSNFDTDQTGTKVVFDFTPTSREIVVKIDPVSRHQWQVPYYMDWENRSGGHPGVPTEKSYGTVKAYLATPSSQFAGFSNSVRANVWIRGGEDFAVRSFQPVAGLSIEAGDLQVVPAIRQAGELHQEESLDIASLPDIVRDTVAHAISEEHCVSATIQPELPMLVPGALEHLLANATEVVQGERQSGEAASSDPTKHAEPVAVSEESTQQTLVQPRIAGVDYTLKDLATNYYQFSVQAINSGFTTAAWNFPNDVLKAQALFSQFPITMWRGNARIRVTPISNNWVSGMAILSFIPMSDGSISYSTQRLSTLPHVLLDFASQTPVTLDVNFQHYLNFFTESDLAGSTLNPMGILILQIVNPPIFQSGGQSAFQVRLEIAWRDVEYFVPRPIGSDPVSLAISKRLAIREVRGERQSGTKESQSGDVQQSTVKDTAQSSSSAAAKAAISPLGNSFQWPDEPNQVTSLRDVLKRPTVFSRTTAGSTPSLQQLGDLGFAQNSNAQYILAPYAGYTGGTVYQFDMRELLVNQPGSGLYFYVPTAYSSAGADLPGGSITTLESLNSSITSGNMPFTEAVAEGKGRITFRMPFKCHNRWAGIPTVNGASNGNLATSNSVNQAVLFYYIVSNAASTYTTILSSADDNFRAGVWYGLPVFQLPTTPGTIGNTTIGTWFKNPSLVR